jgi:hypothetical protein
MIEGSGSTKHDMSIQGFNYRNQGNGDDQVMVPGMKHRISTRSSETPFQL